MDYDKYPYISVPIPETDLRVLHTLAQMFGIESALPENCNVLELGCASGGNLIPMAERYPQSSFTGIDISTVQINGARNRLGDLNLKNIIFLCEDISQKTCVSGFYDFMICHGVYSWVNPETQKDILHLIEHSLTENGTAYISFNTLPGWHIRGIVRDLMLFYMKGKEPEFIKEAIRLSDHAILALTQRQPYLGKVLRHEIEMLKKHSENYIQHEYLAEYNEAIYLSEFIRRVEAAGLYYVCDTDALKMSHSDNESATRDSDQYLDFLNNRMFRRALVSKKEPKCNIMASL